MPVLTLYKQSTLTGALSPAIASASDSSATNTDYKLAHDISLTGLNEVIDNINYIYWWFLDGETGANKQSISVNTGRWTVDVAAHDQGG